MTALAALQRALQARVLHGSRTIDTEIAARDPHQCERRLRIYEHAYVVRLVDALGDTYEALRASIGESEFGRLATCFVRAVPSVHRSIRDYGAEFPSYIAQNVAGIEGRALAELASWEWLLASVFDAPDASVLTVDVLAGVPPDRWAELRFVPHPAVRRFTSTTNAIELWRVVTDAETAKQPSTACLCEARPALDWLAWRSSLTTMYRSLPVDETRAIDAMLEGAVFADICEMLASHGEPEQAPLRAAQLLRSWVEAGLVSAVTS